MKRNQIQIDQLESKLEPYSKLSRSIQPSQGWIRTIRTSLGMSLEQLGRKMNITRQSAQHMEKRESEGSITIKTLREAGDVMGMKLVYGYFPMEGSVEKLIEKRARIIATEIVMRTSASMKLEDQENRSERLEKAIEERAREIVLEMPKLLWD